MTVCEAARPRSIDLAGVRPLMSRYLTDGVHQDRFSLQDIDLQGAAAHGRFALDSFGVSPEDAGGFHLTAPTVFRMAGQLVVIHVHWLAGLQEKAVEVWVRDHQMSHRRPSRDPARVVVTMALRSARSAMRNPGMLRVEYEATIEDGDVVGRTVTYADFGHHPEALARARHTLQEGGLWMAD